VRLPGSGRLGAGHMGNRLIAVSGLNSDVVNFRGNILGQVVQQDRVNARSGITRVEHGLPLHEARWRNLEFGTGGKGEGEINPRPGTPVAVGIVNIAAAGVEIDVGIAGAADADASPEGKDVRIEDIAFVRAFRLGSGPRTKIFPGCCWRRRVPPGRGGEGGDLCGAGFDEIGEIVDAVDGKNVTAIAGAGDEASVLIEG